MPTKWCATCNSYQKSWSEVCKGHCGNDCDDRCYSCNRLFSGELTAPSASTLAITTQTAQAIGRTLDSLVDQNPRNRYTASIEVNPKTGNVNYSLSAERK